MSFNGVVAIARPICTCSTLPMKVLTLHEFGFKPRSKMMKKKSSTASVLGFDIKKCGLNIRIMKVII
jgi:hypothetical protein